MLTTLKKIISESLMKMIPHLPDEIWLKILQYVPLQHRLQHMQFVDRRLCRLCSDGALNATLNVINGLRVPERKSLALLSRISRSLTTLSFENCHWLSQTFFLKLPSLPSLNSLNFGPCYLPHDKLYGFFANCPHLRNLVVHLTIEDVQHLHAVQTESPDNWPVKELERLHVIFDIGDAKGYVLVNMVQKLYDTFFPRLIPASFSVEALDGIHIRHVYHVSKEVMDFAQPYMNNAKESEIFCENAMSLGIRSLSSRSFDFDKLKFLVLPGTMWMKNPCTHQVVCPNEMHNLVYLSVKMVNYNVDDIVCGNIFSKNVFFNCDCVNLKSLKLHLSRFLTMEKFYARVSCFLMLEELILGGTLVKVNLLLKYIEPLKQLQSLSVRLDKSIYEAADGETQCDGDEFLTSLYQSHPKMKKMDIFIVVKDHHTHSKILKPLKFFEHLEILQVDGFDVMNSLKFSKILKHLYSLRTLSLIAQDKTSSCDFDIFLRDSLHLLPRITRLHFQHDRVSFFNVLQNCSRCKKLEKLMIRSGSKIYSGALCALKECITDLPTLEMIVIISDGVQDELMNGIHKLQEQLQSSTRRNILIYCGELENIPRDFQSVALSHDFSPHQPYHFW